MTPTQVPGLITEQAGALLQQLASRVPRGHCVVEIGAFQGRSTCFLGTGARVSGARVYSIDPWDTPGNAPGKWGRFVAVENRAAYARHLAACGVADLVTPIQMFSQLAPVPAEPIGLLWIDGAHDEKSVAADVDRFAPHVAPGGVLVFDDYGTHHPGVDRIVGRLRKDTRWASWSFAVQPLAVAVRQ